jgi:nucleoside permease NupC
MGADWNDATKVGELIGIKILINEFVAYTELKALEGIISVSAVLIIFHSPSILLFAFEFKPQIICSTIINKAQ